MDLFSRFFGDQSEDSAPVDYRLHVGPPCRQPPFDAAALDAFAGHLKLARCAEAFGIWRETLMPDGLPHYDTLFPRRLAALAPYLSIIERIGDRERFRYYGYVKAQRFGDYTGKYFDEIFSGEVLAGLKASAQPVYEQGCPLIEVRVTDVLQVYDNRRMRYEIMTLPVRRQLADESEVFLFSVADVGVD